VKSEYVIRPAITADFKSIFKIESEAFRSPWTIEGLLTELVSPRARFIVCEHQGEIAGYALVWVVAGELHLLKIATAFGNRRRGIASALIAYIINEFKDASVMLLEVREKNVEARSFYNKLGFVENGLRKNYYSDDNAVLIEKQLI
jgi:[ribosomal protein S18]-alanine N-acetyltransferase